MLLLTNNAGLTVVLTADKLAAVGLDRDEEAVDHCGMGTDTVVFSIEFVVLVGVLSGPFKIV